MDKQNQIEEMEKDIAVRMAMAKGVAGSMNKGVEGWLSEYLYNAGYRKLPEGAVVLTREEYQMLNYFNHRGEELLKQERKETAEKFAERLKEMAYQSSDWSHGVHPMVVEVDYIDEVCEELMEVNNGKEEN